MKTTYIIGSSVATAQQLATFLLKNNPKPKFSRSITALVFAQLYISIGDKECVRGDIAFIQMCKETGFLEYGGDVQYWQNNFAGLGATGNGEKGCVFNTIEIGILAHIQHLKSYATKDALSEPNVDPRRTDWFMSVKGGTCPCVEMLGGTWAVPGYDTKKYISLEEANKKQDSYGYQIINMLNKALGEVQNMAIRCAIDAGHGSKTAGKRTVNGYKEHWINVKVAYYCEQLLLAHGVEVVRIGWDDTISTDDVDIPLAQRQQLVKDSGAEYSISCHANAHGTGFVWTAASGCEVLIHIKPERQGDSLAMATRMQNRLIQGTQQKNRGVRTKALSMCNCLAMNTKASVLAEIGFMTNKYEADLMQTDAFCKEQGEDLAKGFLDYVGIKVKNVESKPVNTIPDTTTETLNEVYEVQKGDTLSKIGKKLGIAWQTIAELNNLKLPYNIRVGQKLIVSEKTSVAAAATNFAVRPKTALNIRKSPNGEIVLKNGAKKNNIYTIVEVDGNWGLLKSYQKNRNGWICISDKYCTRQ